MLRTRKTWTWEGSRPRYATHEAVYSGYYTILLAASCFFFNPQAPQVASSSPPKRHRLLASSTPKRHRLLLPQAAYLRHWLTCSSSHCGARPFWRTIMRSVSERGAAGAPEAGTPKARTVRGWSHLSTTALRRKYVYVCLNSSLDKNLQQNLWLALGTTPTTSHSCWTALWRC